MTNFSVFDRCIVCESTKLKDLPNYEKAYLCQCRNCDMVFTKRIPSKEELESYYSNYGTNHYRSKLTIKRYNELLDVFEKNRKTNNILDIGCGVGFFLEEAKKKGWNVYGSEYGEKLVTICEEKGIKMHNGTIAEFTSEVKFDIITSFEVIEHINDPISELKKVHKLLRPKGLFYCTTPNFNSVLRFYLKKDYNVISYPEHLSYYTPKTIHQLFKRNHFKKNWIKTTGISITRLKTSLGKSKEKMVSDRSSDELIRNKIESNNILLGMKRLANKLLSLLGLGMTIKALYEKV